MTHAVIPFQFDLPADSPLLSDNAGVVQAVLARVEQAVAQAIADELGFEVPTVAIWPMHGTHRRTITDREIAEEAPSVTQPFRPTVQSVEKAAYVHSEEQIAAIAKIHTSHRTIIAGAPGTGRTMTAVMAARIWHAELIEARVKDGSIVSGPALIVVADEQKRSSIIMLPNGDGTMVYTYEDVMRIKNPCDFLNRFSLVLLDDAGPSDDPDVATVLDVVLRKADIAHVARFVASGRNDDDATIVLKTVYRQA